MKVYPNPITDKATLEILPPLAGDAIISIYEMSGKVLTQFKGYLQNCPQVFSLSGIKSGFHLINVQGNGYQFSEKLLSNGKSNGTAKISKVSINIQSVAEKKTMKESKGVQATVDMVYSSGERLKYTAVSGNNKTVMTDIPIANKTVTFTFTECKDGENNYYPVVQINTQLWMAENLKTTKYNDGTAIPNVTDPSTWQVTTSGGYCDYNNTPSNSTAYGRLYNWFALDNNAATKVASNGGKNVCPTGWHVPIDGEWSTLTTYLGGESVAGGKLKEVNIANWFTPNTGGTNETGFTALPCGNRLDNGTYHDVGYFGYWWSTTEYNATAAWYRIMSYNLTAVFRSNYPKQAGFSIRCLKD